MPPVRHTVYVLHSLHLVRVQDSYVYKVAITYMAHGRLCKLV